MTKRQNDEMINNDLQNTTQKTKDKATRIPRKKSDWTQVLRKGSSLLCWLTFYIYSNIEQI